MSSNWKSKTIRAGARPTSRGPRLVCRISKSRYSQRNTIRKPPGATCESTRRGNRCRNVPLPFGTLP